ncbi:MAG: AMP-binding protein [Streptosporangiales bacterium]|nr:AMP-binding protein [Streptosporangiales bacterium]
MTGPQVLGERAAVEEAIRGQTVCDWLARTVDKHGDAPALASRVDGQWHALTWRETRERALEAAAGLMSLGLAKGDTVAIMAPNVPEHVIADLGVLHAGGVPMTVYATLAPEQVGYVAADSRATIAILAGEEQLDRWRPILDQLSGLRHVVVLDPAALPSGEAYLSWAELLRRGREQLRAHPSGPDSVAERWHSIRPGDPVTLLYTSGTTGPPKGVVLTHHNVLYEVEATASAGRLPELLTAVSYLPIAHIAERVLSIYMAISRAAHLHFCPDPTELATVLREARPTMLFAVPRVLEKIRVGLTSLLDAEPDEGKKAAIQQAVEVGREYVESSQYGRQVTPELAERYRQADEAVLSKIRAALGFDRLIWLSSGAAPLAVDLASFYAGLGLPIYEVYGMTESTGAVTGNRPDAFRIGSVGQAHSGVELRIAEDGEILVRGPLATPGYLNRPEATSDLIDEDGWLHTGDVGRLDEDGFLYVVDRKKELIITSGGKNISPANIESLLKEHSLVDQALAYGDDRPYVVALIVLDGELAPAWARSHGIEFTDQARLAEHPAILDEVGKAVAASNERLARVEQVKTFRILPTEWTAESEELTPTLKLRRRVIHSKYADVIDQLYA